MMFFNHMIFFDLRASPLGKEDGAKLKPFGYSYAFRWPCKDCVCLCGLVNISFLFEMHT
jgi:hypothetical protein